MKTVNERTLLTFEMSLDAQDLGNQRLDIETFVLVCGDRDFIPIVKKLQQRGRKVHVIGLRVTTRRDLQNFVDSNYTAVEDLLGIIPVKKTSAQPTMHMPETISVEAIAAKLASTEKRPNFVAVSHFLNNIVEGEFSEKSVAFNEAVEQGLVELYQIPNPKNAQFPTKCCRLNPDHPRVKELAKTTN
jgi:hypothetical protein